MNYKLLKSQVLLKLIPALLAPPIRLIERLFWSTPKSEFRIPPVFIVGSPRSGSTILYQALTNTYDLAYIDNTACTWRRNLRFGMWLSQKKYGSSPHNNFDADYGNTSNFGGHAPSECGAFWYRWLPRNRHFIDFSDIKPSIVHGINSEIMAISFFLKKTIVFKNLNMGQRLRLVKEIFPDAKIIFIRRDPRFVIRSIQNARKDLGINPGQWWSIMPPETESIRYLSEDEVCAAQVYYIEKQIDEDLSLFPRSNIKEIYYNDLSESVIHHLGEWIGANKRLYGNFPEFKKDKIATIPLSELTSLNKIAKLYPFKKEFFI